MTIMDRPEQTNSLLALGATIYAARQTGLHRIGADGEAWNLYQRWLPNQELPTLAIAAAGVLLLAAINGGVARSEDGGSNWEARQFRAPAPLATCLALSPAFEADGCALAGTFEDGVFRSSDGGQTWRAANHGLFDHSVYALALSPSFADDGVAFAGTGSGLYRSENGGSLWQDLIMPAGDETILSLALSDCGALYAGCEAHGLLRSKDGGATWRTLLEADGAVNGVTLAASGAIMAQVDDGVLHSTDEGASWSEAAAANVDCMALGADGESLVLALADGRVIRQDV